MRTRKQISLLVGLVLAASVIPASSALAEESSIIEIHDQANIAFNGTAVSVAVDVSCRPGLGYLGVLVLQKRGNKNIHGFGQMTVECDGTVHTYHVLVEAGYEAFKRGVAAARAEIRTCSHTGCQDVTDVDEIRIR